MSELDWLRSNLNAAKVLGIVTKKQPTTSPHKRHAPDSAGQDSPPAKRLRLLRATRLPKVFLPVQLLPTSSTSLMDPLAFALPSPAAQTATAHARFATTFDHPYNRKEPPQPRKRKKKAKKTKPRLDFVPYTVREGPEEAEVCMRMVGTQTGSKEGKDEKLQRQHKCTFKIKGVVKRDVKIQTGEEVELPEIQLRAGGKVRCDSCRFVQFWVRVSCDVESFLYKIR